MFSASSEIMASVNFFTLSCFWASENTPSIPLASSLRVHTARAASLYVGWLLAFWATPTMTAAPPTDRTRGAIRTVRELEELERESIIAALESAEGRVAGANGAAERLGTKPSTLRSRMKALGIGRPD